MMTFADRTLDVCSNTFCAGGGVLGNGYGSSLEETNVSGTIQECLVD